MIENHDQDGIYDIDSRLNEPPELVARGRGRSQGDPAVPHPAAASGRSENVAGLMAIIGRTRQSG